MRLKSYAICAAGLVRRDNQDNLYINGVFRENVNDNSPFRCAGVSEKKGFFAVADGMGGEAHGALASLVAVQAMNSINTADGLHGMVDYLKERNAIICNMIMMNDGARIGSTFVGLSIVGDRAEIINIGDSRAYLLRDGFLSQLSKDHTPIRQMMDKGVLTPEAARTHPDRHRLTQHLGVFQTEMGISPHIMSMGCQPGDTYLLCSDGLTDMLDDSAIRGILASSDSIEKGAEILFGEAIRNGGADNITIVLIKASKKGVFKA